MNGFIVLLIIVLLVALGPFLLLFGLSLLGVPVTYSFGQWLGAFIVLLLVGRGR